MIFCLNARYISGLGTITGTAPKPSQVLMTVGDDHTRILRPSRSAGVKTGRVAMNPRWSNCFQVQSASRKKAPCASVLSIAGFHKSLV